MIRESEQRPDFVKWFSELDKNSGSIAGGKGANLAEIYNMKIPVPPGFVITAQAYDYFIEKARIKDEIKKLLSNINYEDSKLLEDRTKKIRELIINSKMPSEMEEEILEAYDNLNADESIASDHPLNILKKSSGQLFVAVRSSSTTEDLVDASFAGQQETFVNVRGNEELIKNIKKCFASLFTARATYYRQKKGFKHEESKLSVIIQKMVNSDKSGVIFSKDPTFKNENTIIEAVWGLGEGIVSGAITPDKYVVSKDLELLDKKISNKKIAIVRDADEGKKTVNLSEERSGQQVLTPYEIKRLAEFGLRLEEHYNIPQDIEFAIEDDNIYIVQTRAITTLEKRVIKGDEKEVTGEVILTGLAASPGIASGKVIIINDMSDLQNVKKGDVLVTKMTNPDMVLSMQKSVAIVTDEGGLTAHAAIVSREMGIPCVVGTEEATIKLKGGDIITVDGFTGKVYKGKTGETKLKDVQQIAARTRTKIKVMVDLPSFAKRASKTGVKEIGLTRIEGIIAESGKHPNYFLEKNKIKDYEDIIYKGVKSIVEFFDGIWVRTSDIRSDEFRNLEGAPKEIEANPMLGMHGIRFGIKNPSILKAELNALKRISDLRKKVGVLLPQVIDVSEVREVKKILEEIKFGNAKIGIMVETPAAVQLIKEFIDEGIDFISFGTNDLTQYILAVDRGNEQVQHLYDEMHPSILYQLEYVIRVCKRNGVETSICGQAGSKKEMVKFLVEKEIDSISVNADAAKEISDYVKELEGERVKATDKEPRKYQKDKATSTVEKIEEGIEKIAKAASIGNIEENVIEGEEEVEDIAEEAKEKLFYKEQVPEVDEEENL
jgi:pyruvate,water dikinase